MYNREESIKNKSNFILGLSFNEINNVVKELKTEDYENVDEMYRMF